MTISYLLLRFKKLLVVQLPVLVQVIIFDRLVHLLHGHFLLGQLQLPLGYVAVLVSIHRLKGCLADNFYRINIIYNINIAVV